MSVEDCIEEFVPCPGGGRTGLLDSRKQILQGYLPLSQKVVSLQTGALVDNLHLDGKVFHLRNRKGVKVEVLIEDGVAAVLDNGAPLFLELSRVQVQSHATIDALHVKLLIVEVLGCQHADVKPGGVNIVVCAEA